jgi:hypothetical protein
MTTHRNVAAVLWLLAAAATLAIGAIWAPGAQSGKLSPWTLVAFFWGAALLSVLIHYLSHGPDALRRYRLQHKATAAQRSGAKFGK